MLKDQKMNLNMQNIIIYLFIYFFQNDLDALI